MIPYFKIVSFSLGPVTIFMWGLMVALGIVVGLWIARKAAKQRGIEKEIFLDAAFWIIVAGFVGARLGHALFYEPAQYGNDPLEILRVWHGGMSSLGGFIGAAVVGVWYVRRRSPMQREQFTVWRFADAAAFGLPWGWMIGRIGCFLIHDHPGTLTHFFLAVREPGSLGEAGWGRHDLGLYDALLAFGIGMVLLLVAARDRKMRVTRRFDGFYILLITTLYAIGRFFLDFLRASDVPNADARYLGLTPAQYGMILALAFVACAWYKKCVREKGEFA